MPTRVYPARPAQRRKVLCITLGVALFILLVAIGILSAVKALQRENAFPQSYSMPDSWIQYGGMDVPLYENMPLCSYADSDFSLAENGRVLYPGASLGIDVSEHQGEIDWNSVAADGVEWAILRIGRRGYTEGGLFDDTFYAANFSGATAAGLDVGVYFFSQAVNVKEAEEEARFVVKALDGQKLALPVVFDWEEITSDDSRTRSVSSDTITSMTNAFCSIVREAGYDTLVYLNRNAAYRRIDLAALEGTPVWIASYHETPEYYYDFSIWQYTNEGTVSGVNRTVDLNLKMPAAQ